MLKSVSARRLLSVTATFLLAYGLAACGGSDDEQSGNSTLQATTAEVTAPPEKPGVVNAPGTERGDPPTDASPEVAGKGAREPSDTNSRRSSGDEKSNVVGVVEGMYSDLAAGDATGVCSTMSKAAQEQIAQNVPGGSTEPAEERTCAKSMSAFLGPASRSGVLERTLGAEVTQVTIRGRTAIATVAFKNASGKIALTKENGAWKFGADAVAPAS
jgi:hypothetical protein